MSTLNSGAKREIEAMLVNINIFRIGYCSCATKASIVTLIEMEEVPNGKPFITMAYVGFLISISFKEF